MKALRSNPSLNHAYAETKGQPFRVVRDQVNIGIAVDVAGKDGTRSLKVPNIKDAGSMDFAQFVTAFDDIIFRARNNKLTVPDFEGTTISLTNPGTVGTLGSVPRLMPGQGAIIATGAIDYPAEYHGVTEQLRAQLGLSKVMTVTCTYDHRVVQGAESGTFLGRLQALARRRRRILREDFQRPQDSSQAGSLGAGSDGFHSRPARRAARRSGQGSGGIAAHQCIPGARPSYRGF